MCGFSRAWGCVSKVVLLDDGFQARIEHRKRLEKTRINKFKDNFVLPMKVLYIQKDALFVSATALTSSPARVLCVTTFPWRF